MVLVVDVLSANDYAAINAELPMESGKKIFYVVPLQYCQVGNGEATSPTSIHKKISNSDHVNEQEDKWHAVVEFCQFLDNVVNVEHDTKMFKGKSVLEIGFCTGLPASLAFDQGASTLTLHHPDKFAIDHYVRATLSRNDVPRSRCKFASGKLAGATQSLLGNQKYDVILAPELIQTDEEEFEMLHDMLDSALSSDGIMGFSLMSARAHYPNCSGCLPTFLDYLKSRGRFDSHPRWSSPKSEVAPRKIIQLNRTFR